VLPENALVAPARTDERRGLASLARPKAWPSWNRARISEAVTDTTKMHTSFFVRLTEIYNFCSKDFRLSPSKSYERFNTCLFLRTEKTASLIQA